MLRQLLTMVLGVLPAACGGGGDGRADGSVIAVARGATPDAAQVASIAPRDTAPTTPTASDVAELPRVLLDTRMPTPTGRTITVRRGGNLQAALGSARGGDVIMIEPGATFRGPITLPARRDSGWVIVRSAAPDSLLPAPGERMLPRYAEWLPKIIGGAGNVSPLVTARGARGWRVVAIEVTAPAELETLNALVRIGDASQTSLEQVARDIVLDRVYVHGTSTLDLRRCVMLSSGRTAIIDSYLSDCHAKGADAQAIFGGYGPGPYKIVNSHLEGSGENIMFGGATPGVPGLVPSDIEIRRNYFVTPIAWRNVWLKKNLFETKNAARVLVEGNVLDGSWAQGQVGFAILLKSSNSGDCRWCVSKDITIRYNLIRNVGAGINIAAAEGEGPNPVDSLARRIVVANNIFENVNVPPYTGDGRLVQLLGGVRDVVVEHNTMTTPGRVNAFLSLGSAGAAVNTVIRGNIFTRGEYGAKGEGTGEGSASLSAQPGLVFEGNVLVGTPTQARYPSGTAFAPSAASAPARRGANRVMVDSLTRGVVMR